MLLGNALSRNLSVPVTPVLNITAVSSLSDINSAVNFTFAQIPFPFTVQVTLEDASVRTLSVTWLEGSYSSTTYGTQSFTGTISVVPGVTNTSNLTAAINVVVIDEYYYAFLLAATNQGSTLPSASDQTISAKVYRILNYIRAMSRLSVLYQFIKTGSAQTAFLNMSNPASQKIQALGSSPPTLGVNGSTGTGSGYYRTAANLVNLNIPGGYCSFINGIFGNIQENSLAYGSDDSLSRISSGPRTTTNTKTQRLNSNTVLTVTGVTDASGLWHDSRLNNLQRSQRNASVLAYESVALGSTTNQGLFIHAQQNSTSSPDTFSTRTQQFWGVGTRCVMPLYLYFNALRDGDDSTLDTFISKISTAKTVSQHILNGTTLQEWDAVCTITRGDGKKDIIAGNTAGDVYYWEQGASITATWTKYLLFSTGHDIECIGIIGRDTDGKLLIVTVHSEEAPQAVRLSKAQTTNDKGSYDTIVLSTTLPFSKSLYLYDFGGSGTKDILVGWQGTSTSNGGISRLYYTSGDKFNASNWTQHQVMFAPNMWYLYGFLPNGKFLCAGRNYEFRFLGGAGNGVHTLTVPANPLDTWTMTDIYTANVTVAGVTRVRDFLHFEPVTNLMGNGRTGIVGIDYDSGTFHLLDDNLDGTYTATTMDFGLSDSFTRLKVQSSLTNSRGWWIVIAEDSNAYAVYWDSSKWVFQRTWTTGRHPTDGQWECVDLDNTGVIRNLYANSSISYDTAASRGDIGIATLT